MKTLNNPFVTFGYAGPDYFCDRAEETKKIVSALENERNLTLLAPRRIGKSGLIKNVFHNLEKSKSARCVYVDLYPTHDVSDFIESFATAVFSTLENGWEKAAKAAATFIKSCRPTVAFDPYLGVPKFSFDLATASAQVTLDEIFKYLDRQQSRIVIAFDEFQQIARYPFKGMEALLRAHVQFQTGTRFIFAGSKQRMMDEMFLSANRPFYHSTQIVKIAEIDSARYYAFAQGFFKSAGSDLPIDVFMNIYRRFSGITWNVQLVLNRLYERKPTACTSDDVLEIVDGRHPIVEQLPDAEPFVPNSAKLNTTTDQIMLITGPNMAGKSTYIRQVATIAVMAQMGSFVPASRMRMGVLDRVFTRIGAGDDLARGRSTFLVEMQETANILNNATSKSLIVLDEIGRGTSTFDGISIAWSVAEYLHGRTKAKTLFATHYHELTDLSDSFKGVKNYTVKVKEEGGRVVFLRRIAAGVAEKSFGIHVGAMAGLPQEVVNRAAEILKNLESNELDVNAKEKTVRRPRKKLSEMPGQMTFF